jgi:hypothetical protein
MTSTPIREISIEGLHGRMDMAVDLSPELNLLHGQNGMGKTTLPTPHVDVPLGHYEGGVNSPGGSSRGASIAPATHAPPAAPASTPRPQPVSARCPRSPAEA